MFKPLTDQEAIKIKIALVEDSIDRFDDFYQPASCDMCCGGGDEHQSQLYEFSELLDQGFNVPLEDLEDWLFEKK